MSRRQHITSTALLLAILAQPLASAGGWREAFAIDSRQLWPCGDDALGDIDWRQRVLGVLLPDPPSDSSIRCVVIPAFDPEWVVIADCKRAGSATLEYRLAEKNVWYANWVPMETDGHPRMLGWSESPVPVEVATSQGALSYDTCLALRDLWSVVLQDPSGWNRSGEDGTFYVFFSGTGLEKSCGEVWSPHEGTYLGRLASLVEDLRRLVSENDANLRNGLDRELGERARRLAEEHREAAGSPARR